MTTTPTFRLPFGERRLALTKMAPFNLKGAVHEQAYFGGSSLRQRLIEDMTLRGFSEKTQRGYIRVVSRFAAFLGRSPDSATAEDIRRYQIEQREAGMPAPASLDTIDAEVDRLHAERRQLYRGRVTVVDPALSAKLAELTASTSDKSQSIARMNSALRALLTHVVVEYDQMELALHWKHSGVSRLRYFEPVGRAAGRGRHPLDSSDL